MDLHCLHPLIPVQIFIVNKSKFNSFLTYLQAVIVSALSFAALTSPILWTVPPTETVSALCMSLISLWICFRKSMLFLLSVFPEMNALVQTSQCREALLTISSLKWIISVGNKIALLFYISDEIILKLNGKLGRQWMTRTTHTKAVTHIKNIFVHWSTQDENKNPIPISCL